MTTFGLIHGAGDGGWVWRLVRRRLCELGHDAVAPDLPTDRADATWDDCVGVLVDAVQDVDEVVLVGHSAGGFVLPLAAARLGAMLQVYVAGLVPRAGERPDEWFDHVGWGEALRAAGPSVGDDGDAMAVFHHDVPHHLAAEAIARERPTSTPLGERPWPCVPLSSSPVRYVVTTHDRFLPATVQRRVAAERLGIEDPDEIESGHCVNLSRPVELADLLAAYVAG